MNLLQRRRTLMGKGGEEPVYLYNRGVISDVAGGINNTGYSRNETYNTVTQAPTYLKITCTSTSTASTIRGGRCFTFNNSLPSKYIGKTLHVKYAHKNTSESAKDLIIAFIAESVQNGADEASAYTNYIKKGVYKNQESDFVYGELTLSITRTGYVSICGLKADSSSGGIYDIRFYEVWIE